MDSRTNSWTNFSRISCTNLSAKFVRIRMHFCAKNWLCYEWPVLYCSHVALLPIFQYNITEISTTSLAINFVFIGSNNFKFSTDINLMVLQAISKFGAH